MNNIESLFSDKKLLDLAFTHKSWVNESDGATESNERLEFLGDAVLEFVVSKKLYSEFPQKEEGFLTALRANLVNTINLAELALKINLGEKLKLSRGEEEGGGRENPSILANTVEAVIGALFLDGGIAKSESFIEENILSDLSKKAEEPLKDHKSLLQEKVQAQGFPTPQYRVVDEEGPDHAKVFTIEVLIGGQVKGRGTGKNKSEAAQKAAESALASL